MLKCRRFAYYASREDMLTTEETKQYNETLLCKHQLTILEDGQLEQVLEDEENIADAKGVNSKVTNGTFHCRKNLY